MKNIDNLPCVSPPRSKTATSVNTDERLFKRMSGTRFPASAGVKVNIDTNLLVDTVDSNPNFGIICSQYVLDEAFKVKNFKGGINIVASKKINNTTVDKGAISLVDSSINLESIETDVWQDSEAGVPAAERSTFNLGYLLNSNIYLTGRSKIEKEVINFLFRSISYLIINKNSATESHKDKIKVLQEFIIFFKSADGFDSSIIDKLLSDNLNIISSDIELLITKIFLLGESSLLRISDAINTVKIKLTKIDHSYFINDNAAELRANCTELENDFSVFYFLYRMEYYSNYEKASIMKSPDLKLPKLSSSTSPEKFKEIASCLKLAGVKCAYEDFMTFLFPKCGIAVTKGEFKKSLSDMYDELKYSYALYDNNCKIKNIKYTHKGLKEKSIATEKETIRKHMRKYFSINEIQSHFLDYIFNENNSDKLIDGAFDANDFAICWDSIKMGVPLFTCNIQMQKQVWGNLARAYLLGRDLQIITPNEIELYYRLNRNEIEGGVAGINASHIHRYCSEHRNMSKLWGWSNITKKYTDAFLGTVTGMTFPNIDSGGADEPASYSNRLLKKKDLIIGKIRGAAKNSLFVVATPPKTIKKSSALNRVNAIKGARNLGKKDKSVNEVGAVPLQKSILDKRSSTPEEVSLDVFHSVVSQYINSGGVGEPDAFSKRLFKKKPLGVGKIRAAAKMTLFAADSPPKTTRKSSMRARIFNAVEDGHNLGYKYNRVDEGDIVSLQESILDKRQSAPLVSRSIEEKQDHSTNFLRSSI